MKLTAQEFRQIFDEAFRPVEGTLWGICKLDFSEYQTQYNYGLVAVFPHTERMTAEGYDEARLHELMQEGRETRKVINRLAEQACREHGIGCLVTPIPPDHQSPPYRVPFSAKHCAVRAGLGWIGKSDLLVTREYGPRITTAGFALRVEGVEPEVGRPETESHCGDCDLCVKCCPWHNIKGAGWQEGTTRDALVDYHRCSEMRFKFVPKLGRKLECAKCIVWCPYGTPAAPGE